MNCKEFYDAFCIPCLADPQNLHPAVLTLIWSFIHCEAMCMPLWAFALLFCWCFLKYQWSGRLLRHWHPLCTCLGSFYLAFFEHWSGKHWLTFSKWPTRYAHLRLAFSHWGPGVYRLAFSDWQIRFTPRGIRSFGCMQWRIYPSVLFGVSVLVLTEVNTSGVSLRLSLGCAQLLTVQTWSMQGSCISLSGGPCISSGSLGHKTSRYGQTPYLLLFLSLWWFHSPDAPCPVASFPMACPPWFRDTGSGACWFLLRFA